MNKIIAVFGALLAIGLFTFTIIFFLQTTNLQSETLVQFTSIIAISNLIVAITSTLPFLISLYSNRPMIELDYKTMLYLIDNDLWMSLKIINYGTSEAKNPSLKLYMLHEEEPPKKLVDYHFRYTLMNNHHFEFHLQEKDNQKPPIVGGIYVAEIGYNFFYKRKNIHIPFTAQKTTENKIDIATKKVTGSISYLQPSCLDFEKSQQIIKSFKRRKQ